MYRLAFLYSFTENNVSTLIGDFNADLSAIQYLQNTCCTSAMTAILSYPAKCFCRITVELILVMPSTQLLGSLTVYVKLNQNQNFLYLSHKLEHFHDSLNDRGINCWMAPSDYI